MFRFVCFAVVCALCAVAGPNLQREDLRSVQRAFQTSDFTPNRFWVLAKKPLDSTISLLIVQAAPTVQAPLIGKTKTGVFAVTGAENRVLLVFDLFPTDEATGSPVVGELDDHSVRLHFHSDYGMYRGSAKYVFDLSSEKPARKFPYQMLALVSSKTGSEGLAFSGSSPGRAVEVEIDPRPGDAPPAYRIAYRAAAKSELPVRRDPVRLPDGTSLHVSNTPPGQSHQLAGFLLVRKSGKRDFYPVPVPTMAIHRRLRPGDPKPGEIENDIGPVVQDGSTIWFVNSFYDGEGTSGVGAVGSFDVPTRSFNMRYIPQIASWSGSAIRLDSDDLWIGLMRQPEGAAFGGGLLRYNLKTAAAKVYKIPDYIYTIDRFRDVVYCGTSNGIYGIRGESVMHMVFEPDERGKTVMVTMSK